MAKVRSRWTRGRRRLGSRLFNINYRSGKCVEAGFIAATLLSVIMVFLESTGTPPACQRLYIHGEIALTLLFSIEYLLRLFCAPNRWRYCFSFLGIIDLITLLPIYIILLVPGMAGTYTVMLRLLRVLRILRIIKLMRYMHSARDIWEGLVASYKKLLVFFFIISVIICLFAGAMYVVEGPEHGFTSLPVALYWSAVTVTTVGYGDITPHTAAGRVITSWLILIGYTIVAIPTGILSAHMTNIVQRKRSHRTCRACHYVSEDAEVNFCARCGKRLPKHQR